MGIHHRIPRVHLHYPLHDGPSSFDSNALCNILSAVPRKGAATFLIIKGMQDLIQNPIETGSLTSGQLFSALFVENILGELVVTLSAYILASIACVSC